MPCSQADHRGVKKRADVMSSAAPRGPEKMLVPVGLRVLEVQNFEQATQGLCASSRVPGRARRRPTRI